MSEFKQAISASALAGFNLQKEVKQISNHLEARHKMSVNRVSPAHVFAEPAGFWERLGEKSTEEGTRLQVVPVVSEQRVPRHLPPS